MRLIVTAAAFALASTAAGAQSCYSYGNVVQCSDGTAGYRYGNAALFDATSEPKRNVTPMYTDLGAPYSGDIIIFNDRRSAYVYGDTTVTIDARTCHRHGTGLICKRVPKGPAPSFARGSYLASSAVAAPPLPSAVGAPYAVRVVGQRRQVPKPAPAARETRRPVNEPISVLSGTQRDN